MPVNVLYSTSARATGGRDGHSKTLDGAVDGASGTGDEVPLSIVVVDPQAASSRPAEARAHTRHMCRFSRAAVDAVMAHP